MSALLQNTTLCNGKYEILKTLGQGAFGIAYMAERTDNCERVCIKEFFMKPDSNSSWNFRLEDGMTVSCADDEIIKSTIEKYRGKFKKEAQKLQKVNDTRVVKVYEYFEENNTSYYSMELIDGDNLAEYIKKVKLSEYDSTKIIKDVALALKTLHDNKILHLDIKPKNIMRRNNCDIILIDFGLSKVFDERGNVESSSVSISGLTPGYSPMEQIDFDGNFAPTLDIYALGATFYTLLTGKIPPKAEKILPNKLYPKFIEENLNGYDKNIISIVKRAMNPGIEDRYQSVDKFIKAINTATGKENENKSKKQPKIPHILMWLILGVILSFIIVSIYDKNHKYRELVQEQKEIKEQIEQNKSNNEKITSEILNYSNTIRSNINTINNKIRVLINYESIDEDLAEQINNEVLNIYELQENNKQLIKLANERLRVNAVNNQEITNYISELVNMINETDSSIISLKRYLITKTTY